MCQPPEITLPGGEGLDAARSSDGWSGPSDGWASGNQAALWANDSPQEANNMNTLAAQEQALLLKYGQRQRAAMAQQGAWATGFGSNLAEKLQRAAAAATGTPMLKSAPVPDATSALSWLARAQPFAPMQQAAAAWPAPPLGMPAVSPALVAQGIPMGMAHMGHMEGMGFTHHEEHHDDDDQDPKKFKRMMSNRASAKRSRQRRQERLDELEIVSAKLQVDNATVQRRLNEANERIRKFQEENETLQTELKQLKEIVEARGLALPAHMAPSAQPGTKQDSCGPNGSTTYHPSNSPSAPFSQVSAKRQRDEAAESRFDEGAGGLAPALRRVKADGVQPSPVTPSSAVTSDSEKDVKLQASAPHLVAQELDVLDDDLFTSFMEECFEAKPLDVALAQ